MPYSTVQDADQYFYSDLNIKFTGNPGASPLPANTSVPSAVTVTWNSAGVFTVQLPASYLATNPPIDYELFGNVAGSVTTTPARIIRAVTTGTTPSAGTFVFMTADPASGATPADLTALHIVSLTLKLKFATVFIRTS